MFMGFVNYDDYNHIAAKKQPGWWLPYSSEKY
jgi:hypothetical protein